MELRTVDSIMQAIEEAAERKDSWDAHTWIEAAQSLNALMSHEHDRLFDLQQQVANAKVLLMNQGKTAAYAKLAVEATYDYVQLQRQRARIERIEQTIALAKYQSRIKDNEYRSG